MKKKIIPFTLILAMCAMSAAGCGKKTEEPVQEQIELAPLEEKKLDASEEMTIAKTAPNSVGNMMVYPSGYDDTGCLYGTNTLTFYFENEGVMPGGGLIYVYESPSGANVSSVSTSSAGNVTVSSMDEGGKEYTGWDSGTKIDVAFSEGFEMGKNYFVLLDPGCFKMGENLSKAVSNASLITFRVKDYGFDFDETELSEGESAFPMQIYIGGEADHATVSVSAVSEAAASSSFMDLSADDGALSEGSAEGENADGATEGMPSDSSASYSIAPCEVLESGSTSLDISSIPDGCAFAVNVGFYDLKGQTVDSSTFIVTKGYVDENSLISFQNTVYGTMPSTGDGVIATDGADYAGLSESASTEELLALANMEASDGIGMETSDDGYRDDVIASELSAFTSYKVDSKKDGTGEMTITIAKGEKVLPASVQSGADIVMPANDEHQQGVALHVVSVSDNGSEYVLKGTAPDMTSLKAEKTVDSAKAPVSSDVMPEGSAD